MQDPTSVKIAVAQRDYIPNKLLHTLEGHGFNKEITCIVFHPTQPAMYSSAEDGKIKIWDYETGQGMGSLIGHEGAVKCLAIDVAGARLASCSDDTDIRVFDTATESCIRRLQGHEHTVSHVEWVMPDCRFLASASRDGTIRMWDVQNSCVEKVFRNPGQEWIRSVKIIGKHVIGCGDDHLVKKWTFDGRNERIIGGHDHVIECLAAANQAACEVLKKVEDAKGKDEADDEMDNQDLSSVAAEYVASGGRDKIITIWNITNNTEVLKLVGHKDWVRGLSFHVNGKFLLSCSDDGLVKVWSLSDQRCLRTITVQEMSFVSCIGYHPAGRFLVSGSSDNKIKVYKCE
eukprot:TRINITY_DN11107_c0_g2_i2.p1 TRINITY_DN11107_c0_g2~~TRINITY_DN11107_c0_g2_i2.p1  ORF type:complete len:345 (+),score=73.06 TRINITY_DN11107_c0_g2_i2:337-1371(+)